MLNLASEFLILLLWTFEYQFYALRDNKLGIRLSLSLKLSLTE